MESATVTLGHAHEDEHHGPPEANQSSRIDRQTLGILLFIVSEVMLFGALFSSYVVIRTTAPHWPPEGGLSSEILNVPLATLNTAVPPDSVVTSPVVGATTIDAADTLSLSRFVTATSFGSRPA